jgi:aryl-alcohol dehydrogenase-like predicted oxidoreductase
LILDRKENPHIGLGTAAIGRPQYINIRDRKAEFESLEQFRQKGSAVLEEAWRRGVRYFDTFQLTYNIFDQSISELAEHIHTKNKKLIIKEALANGRIFPNKQYPHYTAHYELLNSLAKKHQTGVDAIALRFCMDSLQPFQVLSGAARTDHIAANLKAQNFQLTEEEIAAFRTLIVEPYTYWTERNALSWN